MKDEFRSKLAGLEAQIEALRAAAGGDDDEEDPEEAHNAVISALGEIAKANVAQGDMLDFGPEVTLDRDPVEAVAKAAGIEIDQDGDLDALPFLAATLGSLDRIAASQEVIGRAIVGDRKDLGVIAKAVGILDHQVALLRGDVAAFLDAGRGSRTQRRPAELVGKSAGPKPADAPPDIPNYEGNDLVAKAVMANSAAPEILPSADVSRLEDWARRGYGLHDLIGKGRLEPIDASPDLVRRMLTAYDRFEQKTRAA